MLCMLATASGLLACQPAGVDFGDLPERKSTLGEMAHAIALSNAEASALCSVEKQASLQGDREAMVSGIDTLLSPELAADMPSLLSSSVLPTLDDRSLDTMLHGLGDSLALLIDPDFDPERKTLGAVVELLSSHTILQDDHLLELGRALLADPELVSGIHALAGLAYQPDGEAIALDSLLFGVSRGLEALQEPSSCEGLGEQLSVEHLLSTAGFDNAPAGGPASWVARVDASGNALAAVDSQSGQLKAPFVDLDGDGEADVNAAGEPIDQAAQVIDIAPFGTGPSYDSQGRRLASEGGLQFSYYDAKRTALGHTLRLAGDAIGAGLIPDAAALLDAMLGEQSPCPPGESDSCFQYSAQGNPLYRMLFAGTELLKYDRPAVFLHTWAQLVRDNPALAEDVLLALGRIGTALQSSSLAASDPEIYALLDAFLPKLAAVFRIETSGGEPMPRLLMDLIDELGQTARDFPDQLQSSIEHTRLIKENECSAEAPDPASPKVDFSRRRFFVVNGSTVDNRSSLEKSLELLVDADCGTVPFTGGKSVAHTIIDLMSRFTPETVCNLIDDLLGLLGVTGNIGEAVVNTALFVVGCGGDEDVEAADLFVLDDLAKSGALDFYLPVARTFREEGELAALLPIFEVLVTDLRGDEDSDANTTSALRPLLPVLVEVLEAGAVDPFFDLNAALVSVPAIDGQGTLADLLIDTAARMLDDTGSVATPQGLAANTSLAEELVEGLRGSALRIELAGRSEELSRLISFALDLLTSTSLDAQGNEQLRDRGLVPVLASGLATLGEAFSLPADAYRCYVEEWQGELRAGLESPALAALVRVALVFGDYEGRAELEAFAARLLDPENLQTPVFGELLRLVAELSQSPLDVDGAEDLLHYLSAVLDPERANGELLQTLDVLVSEDDKGVLLRLLKNALGPMHSPAEDAPLHLLMEVASNYSGIDAQNQCLPSEPEEWSSESLADSVESTVSFLQDEDSLLALVFDLLRKRSGP